jgi:hypothetical protein
MTKEIFYKEDLEKWNDHFDLLPEKDRDVFASPGYLCHAEDNGYGKAVCLFMAEGRSLYYFPFLTVPFNDPRFSDFSKYSDIQGVYGYNGIFTVNPTPDLTAKFNELIGEYAMETKAITAFMRCNPVYGTHLFFDPLCIHHQNENVLLDLTIDDIFNEAYEYSTRKNIRKAEREGLTVSYYRGDTLNDNQLHDFMHIYNSTMDRNQAEQFYYFSEQYFSTLLSDLKKNAYVFFSYKDDHPVSTELILLNSFVGYSFLGGTLHEYYPFRANDYLKHHIINFLKEYGCNYYCLGGGPEGVLRFKKSFATNGSRDFLVYKRVFDKPIYDAINNRWAELNPGKIAKYGAYFQRYRF